MNFANIQGRQARKRLFIYLFCTERSKGAELSGVYYWEGKAAVFVLRSRSFMPVASTRERRYFSQLYWRSFLFLPGDLPDLQLVKLLLYHRGSVRTFFTLLNWFSCKSPIFHLLKVLSKHPTCPSQSPYLAPTGQGLPPLFPLFYYKVFFKSWITVKKKK